MPLTTAVRPAPLSAAVTRSAPEPQRQQHIAVLDGIRGAAISAVVLYHLRSEAPRDLLHSAFSHLSTAGWAGVDLFFVLSGFLITGILLDSRGSANYFRAFYARRALRILPLYYLALAIRFWIAPALWPHASSLAFGRDQLWWALTYLNNVAAVLPGHAASYTSHLWSLAVEEQFYFVWPVIVLVCDARRLRTVILTMIAAAFIVRIPLYLTLSVPGAYMLPFARMDALAIGAFLALERRRHAGLAHLRPLARSLLVASAVVFLAAGAANRLTFNFYEPAIVLFGYSAAGIAGGCLLLLAMTDEPSTKLRRVLESRPMRMLGRYSYGLYVIHWPIYLLILHHGPFTRIPSVLGSRLPAQLAFYAVTFGVSLLLAVASWHLFESRFLRLRKYFAYGSGDPGRISLQLLPGEAS